MGSNPALPLNSEAVLRLSPSIISSHICITILFLCGTVPSVFPYSLVDNPFTENYNYNFYIEYSDTMIALVLRLGSTYA